VGYKRDGKIVNGLSIFHTRDIHKRVYTAFKQRKPDILLVDHVTSSVPRTGTGLLR